MKNKQDWIKKLKKSDPDIDSAALDQAVAKIIRKLDDLNTSIEDMGLNITLSL